MQLVAELYCIKNVCTYSAIYMQVKLCLHYFTNMQHFGSQAINWWTGAVWIVMFLLAVWTLILTAPIQIHCWAMINFFKAVLIRKQTHLHFGWPEGEHFQQIFIFGWNIPLKCQIPCLLISAIWVITCFKRPAVHATEIFALCEIFHPRAIMQWSDLSVWSGCSWDLEGWWGGCLMRSVSCCVVCNDNDDGERVAESSKCRT